MATPEGTTSPEGAGEAEATNGGSHASPTTGGGTTPSPFDGVPPYAEHRRRHDPTGAVHKHPTVPTAEPGETTREEYSKMSSEAIWSSTIPVVTAQSLRLTRNNEIPTEALPTGER